MSVMLLNGLLYCMLFILTSAVMAPRSRLSASPRQSIRPQVSGQTVIINPIGGSADWLSAGPQSLIRPDDCEKSGECFFLYASNQCFCYITLKNPATWNEAKSICQNKKWELAHPANVVALRSALFQWCGDCGHFWLDAKCVGTTMGWGTPVGVKITTSNPYFATPPPPVFATGKCLEMRVTLDAILAHPEKPYFVDGCQNTHQNILCSRYK